MRLRSWVEAAMGKRSQQIKPLEQTKDQMSPSILHPAKAWKGVMFEMTVPISRYDATYICYVLQAALSFFFGFPIHIIVHCAGNGIPLLSSTP